jgi:hypothetical protein
MSSSTETSPHLSYHDFSPNFEGKQGNGDDQLWQEQHHDLRPEAGWRARRGLDILLFTAGIGEHPAAFGDANANEPSGPQSASLSRPTRRAVRKGLRPRLGECGAAAGEWRPHCSPSSTAGWFFGIGRIGSFLAPVVVGFMLQYGAGAYVLHTFALTFLIAAIALWFVGIETKGKTLEEITGGAPRATT